MEYIGTSINESPVITAPAGAELTVAAFKAVKFNAAGAFVLAGAGEAAVGVLLADTTEKAPVGTDLTAQVKDIGLWKSGAAFKAGDLLTSDAQGRAVAAAVGNFILAQALAAADGADQAVRVQIIKAGYAPAGN